MFCRLTSQHRTLHEMCPGNTKTEMGRNTVWKMQYCERTNWGRVKRQTGGGAKSALALNWIDLERFWQCKSLNWHLPESKKVCKYGATMHIEGSRSLWRKNYPSQLLQRVGWGIWLSADMPKLVIISHQSKKKGDISKGKKIHPGKIPLYIGDRI